jgi:hypothetical protein
MSLDHRIVLKAVLPTDMWGRTIAWPVVSPSPREIDAYMKWCKEKVGADNWQYYGEYKKIPFEFRFRRSEDLLAFRLTFGFL